MRFQKLLFFICFCCLSLQLAGEGAPHKQKICLNMIVKDESAVIKRALNSVLPIVDYWVIVDTGSTDGTQQIIQDFMKEKNLPGELFERGWVNFEHNRNEALQLAKDKSDYILFLDADDVFAFDKNFICPDLDKDYYYIPIQYGGYEYSRIMLIKQDLDWNWVGALHEVLVAKPTYSFSKLNQIHCVVSTEGMRSKNPQKYQEDIKVMQQELEKNPNNKRNVFYLAQSYRDAENYPEALKYYEKRVAMGGWKEEVFYSLYQIANIQKALDMPSETVIESYNRAYEFRKSRIEPLFKLAQIENKRKNYAKAYEITKLALDTPPTSDVLFVEKWLYDYGLLIELSVSAYWLDNFEECKRISEKLLENELPEKIKALVEKNLAFANGKLLKKD